MFHFVFVAQVYDALDDSRVLRVRGVKNIEENQVKTNKTCFKKVSRL